jgi:hypothetical protein
MEALTPSERDTVARLINSRFKGYARVRLGKLPPHVLDQLVRFCSSPKDAPLSTDATTEQKVARVLEAKKELEKEVLWMVGQSEARCETPAPPTTPPPDLNDQTAWGWPPDVSPPALTSVPPTVAPAATLVVKPVPRRPIFSTAQEINDVAFNSLRICEAPRVQPPAPVAHARASMRKIDGLRQLALCKAAPAAVSAAGTAGAGAPH